VGRSAAGIDFQKSGLKEAETGFVIDSSALARRIAAVFASSAAVSDSTLDRPNPSW
jgi:hypothetical protein